MNNTKTSWTVLDARIFTNTVLLYLPTYIVGNPNAMILHGNQKVKLSSLDLFSHLSKVQKLKLQVW